MSKLCLLLGLAFAAPREENVNDPTAVSLGMDQEAEGSADLGLSVEGLGVLSLRGGDTSMDNGINIVLGQLEMRYVRPAWGLYATPRLRVINLASGHDQGAAYLQQTYAYARHPWGDIKLGKIYRRFGRLWDYGMYGPLVAVHDITMQADYGLAAEGAPVLGGAWSLDYALQYFPVDGRSISLHNAPLISSASIRRRHIVVGHIAPNLHFAASDAAAVGLSGETFEVRSADGRWQRVSRVAVDVDATHGPMQTFFEAGMQRGTDRLPDLGNAASGDNLFAWAGITYAAPDLNVRYNLGLMRFFDAAQSLEVLHQPGIEFIVHPHLSLVAEAAIYTTSDFTVGTSDGYLERSLYVAAMGNF